LDLTNAQTTHNDDDRDRDTKGVPVADDDSHRR
jgi:hypothetical protein